MKDKKNKISLRSFTSFALVISTLVMSWSGFILYVAPPGRIANWGTWKMMLFTKAEWQALHTIFSYLFFILVIVHLFFVNWKAFLSYLKSKFKTGLNKKRELILSVVISAIIFAGTLESWFPFGEVMTFGNKVKESWGNSFENPPAMHMETYTLRQISPMMDSVPVADLISTLKGQGIIFGESDSTLKQIAEKNKTTPAELYRTLTSKYKVVSPNKSFQESSPQGLGKYTIKMTAENSGKDISEIIRVLKENGVEATAETTLRSVADEMGMTPRDLYNMLTTK